MHPNPIFRNEPPFLHLNLVRWRGFGTLVVPRADALPMMSHIPFVMNDEATEIELHLVRSNPIARVATDPMRALIAVSGPDGYISPDWYEDPEHGQVPTWNYVAVHMTGTLEPRPAEELRGHLDRLSTWFENLLAPKRPWTTDKMPPEKLEGMMRALCLYRFRIEEVDGTWKLSQNKSESQRDKAAEAIRHSAIGHETEALAVMMKGAGPIVGLY